MAGGRRRSARIRAALALALTAGAVALLPTGAATADREDEVKAKIADSQADLEHASAESLRIAAQVKAAESSLPLAEAAVRASRAAEQAARKEANRAKAAAARATAEVRAAEQRVAEVRADIDSTETAVGLIARRLYQAGGVESQWATVLKAESPADLAGRIAAVRTVGTSTDAALDRLAAAEIELETLRLAAIEAAKRAEAERQIAEEKLAEAASSAEAAEDAEARVRQLVRDRNSALAAAKADEAAERQRLAALQAERRKIQAELERLAAGYGGPGIKGELIWPADGALSQGVGPRVHPVYGYASCHTGIDISAGYGAPIRAAAAGTVVSTASSAVWGNYTLIAHGGGVVTMYAHQSRFGADPGQQVSGGQVIGYVGSTGYSTGPHLHFEVHIDGIPYNPLGWFGGTKSPVVC